MLITCQSFVILFLIGLVQGLLSQVGQSQDPGKRAIKCKVDPSKQYIGAENSLLGSTNRLIYRFWISCHALRLPKIAGLAVFYKSEPI